METFRWVTSLLVTISVLAFAFASLMASSGQSGGLLIFGIIAGLFPTLIFQFQVKNDRATWFYGVVLLITTVPAWVLPIFSENEFALFYALFFVFPITLVMCIVGATAGKSRTG